MPNPYKHYGDTKPYYDDFDPSKNYVKTLYNPGVALQARELTQSQTYLDYQIATIGGYLFRDGSAVDGAKISYSTKQPVMKIATVDETGTAIKLDELVMKKFIGQESEQMIEVTGHYTDPITGDCYLLFSYMGKSITPGEKFITYNESRVRSFKSLNSGVQNAIVGACTEGHLFVDGYFIYVPKSNVVVSIPANDDTVYHIGFKITRNKITANEDGSLHDPADGTYNFKAPGADRYQLKTELVAFRDDDQPIDTEFSGISYVTGIIIKGDTVIKEQDLETNSTLTDMLARRTYEESGSYTVNPWKVQLKETTKEDLQNIGIADATDELAKEYYNVCIEPGSGYIYGYRVSTLVSETIPVKKPRTWIEKTKNLDYVPNGMYTYAQYEPNSSDTNEYAFRALQASYFPSFLSMETVDVMSDVKGTGTKLGECKIVDLYKQGTYLLVYLTDATGVIGKFGSAKSLVSQKEPTKYVNLYMNSENCAELYGTDAAKIIPTGYSMITPAVSSDSQSNVMNYNPMQGSINYKFIKTYPSIPAKTTKSSIEFNTNNDGYNFDREGLLYIYNTDTGKHVDITNMNVDVSSNTVVISAINNAEPFIAGGSYTVCGRVSYIGGSLREKIATKPDPVELTLESDGDTLKLPEEDIIDVLSIKAGDVELVVDGKLNEKLTLDNGQRDYVYDYGKITGFKSLESNATKYTVTYRYYKHGSAAGPFSAGSYVTNSNKNVLTDYADLYSMIPMYRSTSTGVRYQLRDCLDFRVKTSELAKNAISYFPSAKSELSYNAAIYLPRIDAVWVDKSGNFGVTTGIPSQSPEAPEQKDGTMTLYYLYNEAYVHGINNVNLRYVNNQRYTMTDINKLEKRLYNVENVVALSMLEQSAVNMQITDESGLNRYKTGIFTDNFGSFDNSDYTNPDWNCTIDAIECSIRPLFECEEHPFKLSSMTNAEKNDVILTLKNTGTSIYAKNDALSESTNIQSLMFYVWTGSLKLVPSIDTWVNDLGNIIVSETYVETPKPPTTYRTWSVTNVTSIDAKKSTSTSTSTSTERRYTGDRWGSYWNDTYKNTTTTTSITSIANTETKTTTETTSYVGSWVASDQYTSMESQDAFMRERTIEYSLSGMRAGMQVEATMDGVQLKLSDDIVKPDGSLNGTFKIPAKMTVGTKLIEFYDSALTSAASAEYTANGKTVWTNVDRTYIRTWTSVISTDTKTTYGTKNLGTVTSSSTSREKIRSVYRDLDPIAESFMVDTPNGIMLESIDLYFAKKDENVNVELIIVECENGYPGQNMVPFSRVSLTPDQVNVTESVTFGTYPEATKFKFESPLYLAPETEYAFIVIAPSYNYEIYTSTLGKADLSTGIGIREQPYIGSMFKSQNLRTWTAEQLSDITFKMHRYNYTPNSVATAIFDIEVPHDKDKNGNDIEHVFKSAMNTLAINSFVPNKTNVEYSYKWNNDAEFTRFNNKEDIFNSKIKTLSSNTNNGVSLQIRLDLITEDSNISPMIDLEQVYGIFTNNIVSESKDPAFAYNCGSYISNSVSLDNASSDLRVIVDAILPNESDIKVLFKTSSYKPLYVKHATAGNFVNNPDDVIANIGNIMQVYYYNPKTGKFQLPSARNQSQCIITGYDANERKIYLRSISNQSDFHDAYTDDNGEQERYPSLNNNNINAICLLPILGTTEITCPAWSKTTFTAGSYVLHDGYMWKANINTIAANEPSELSVAWTKILGIKTMSAVIEEGVIEWRPMQKEFSETTIDPSIGFIEYTYKPTLELESDFTDFAIRIDMYSQDEVNVPRVKNLRAIAIV